MIAERLDHGAPTLAPARAPRLRRLATRLDEQAERARNPTAAHALACEMRLRASELEGAGNRSSGDADEATALLAELVV